LKKVSIFDASYVTDNLGDQIIMESVIKHLRNIFHQGFFTGIPTHDYPGKHSFEKLKSADFVFVGGTNMLSSHWLWYHQWKLRLIDLSRAGHPILMGVGWHKYQSDPDFITRAIYKKVLHPSLMHSLRDVYTYEKLKRSGISNAIYTGCPTMWDLDDDHISRIPLKKSQDVFFTLTGYLKDPQSDCEFVERLKKQYRKLYFWPQMYEDLAYLKSLTNTEINVVEPNIPAARQLLQNGDIDYVGMRLHCGVLALQCGVRALIVEVDNRATEIAKNTNLQTVKRGTFDHIDQWIQRAPPIKLDIPLANIRSWKSQFSD
jgi:polysaccharide pyruvyl transferase WcaK-like protein